MPLIDVTYAGTVGEEVLHRLGEVLPDAVAEAVDCPEEPELTRRVARGVHRSVRIPYIGHWRRMRSSAGAS